MSDYPVPRNGERVRLVVEGVWSDAYASGPVVLRDDGWLTRVDAVQWDRVEVISTRLTPRVADVLRLVEEGLSAAQIARRLWLTPNTVKSHMAIARRAMRTNSTRDAADQARRLGLLDEEVTGDGVAV